jgi:hypothetical protein
LSVGVQGGSAAVGGFVLFIHEVHKVRGQLTDDFELGFRDTWMPKLAETDDARLLVYANQCHGGASSNTVVTITGIQNGAAWDRLALRLQTGDLQKWMRSMDELRHEVEAKLLVPLPWSPLQDTRLAGVPVDGREHEPRLYLEDTMWPCHDKFEEYVDRCGEVYASSQGRTPSMQIDAAFQHALGCHLRREVTLVQRIGRPEALVDLLRARLPPAHRVPGTWMHDALDLRHLWRSRLLRTAAWSPLY